MIVRHLTITAGVVAGAIGLAAFTGQPVAEEPEKPTELVARENCVTSECHTDVKSRPSLHGPLHVNACDACHIITSVEEHTYEFVREEADLCLFCHEVNLEGYSVVHQPMLTGECIGCHDPHGGSDRNNLRGETYPDMCARCHDDVVGSMRAVHGPAAAGACGACHEPHVSDFPNLLNTEGKDLCLQCHVSTQTQLETMLVVHQPAEVDCQICHDPHATQYDMLLIDEAPGLCEGCHESIHDEVESATMPHGAVVTKRSCLNCHRPHASDHPLILRDEPGVLCFECHAEEVKLNDGRMMPNIKAVVEEGAHLHGPVRDGQCAACHEIHGGKNRGLLLEEYPEGFYRAFNGNDYALCFNCHDRHLADEEITTVVTGFRNGEVNLHYLHVNDEHKGRACRVCHDSHAGQNDKFIRESVAFGPGGWMLPIRYMPLENGGRCAGGCHSPYEYNRIEPIINIVRPVVNGKSDPDEPPIENDSPTPKADTEPEGGDR